MRWQPSRREWFAAVAGGCAVLGCGDGAAPDRFAGLAIGVETWSLREFPLEVALDMAARLGFARVELSPGEAPPGHLQFPATDDEIAALRELVLQYGLPCLTAHVAPRGVDYVPDRAVFDYARKLGLRTIMITQMSDELDALVAEYDVRVGLHNHTGSAFSSIDAIQQAIDGRDPRIGTIVDTGHYLRVGIDPLEALQAFTGRVYGIHLKDVVAADPQAPDAVVGEGVLDLVGVLRALRALPADATISVEYESNPFDPYPDLQRALDNVSRAAHASR
jgi:sugar phosphate isomerase/epimerase